MTTWRLDLATLSDQAEEGISTDVLRQDLLLEDADQGQALAFSYTLNGPGTLEFVLPIDKPTRADYAVGQREVHLYRDGTLVWGGYLVRAESDGVFVRFGCLGWLWRLRRRLITEDMVFIDQEPGHIAWALIDWAQQQPGGNMGITLQVDPLPTPGEIRSTIYCSLNRPNVGDTIDELSEMKAGFDFDITPDKVFTVWSPERGSALPVTLDAGRQTVAVTGITEDASEVVSELSVLGPQEACSDDDGLFLTDASAFAAYGLLQADVQYDNRDERIRQRRGDAELDILKRINLQPRVTMQRAGLTGELAWGAVTLGDTVRFVSDHGFATYNFEARVIGQEYEVLPAGVETWHWQLDGLV